MEKPNENDIKCSFLSLKNLCQLMFMKFTWNQRFQETNECIWTYWTHGNALLPLTHAQTLFQRCAFLHDHVPATIRVLGSNACTVDENQSDKQDIYYLHLY